MTAHTKTFGQYVKDLSEEELIEKYHNTSNDEVLFEWVVKELRFRGWRVDKHSIQISNIEHRSMT